MAKHRQQPQQMPKKIQRTCLSIGFYTFGQFLEAKVYSTGRTVKHAKSKLGESKCQVLPSIVEMPTFKHRTLSDIIVHWVCILYHSML